LTGVFRFDPKRRTITIGYSKFILRHSCFTNHFLVSSHDSIFVSLFSVLFKLSSLFAAVLRALYYLGFFFFISSNLSRSATPHNEPTLFSWLYNPAVHPPSPILYLLVSLSVKIMVFNPLLTPWNDVLPLPLWNKPTRKYNIYILTHFLIYMNYFIHSIIQTYYTHVHVHAHAYILYYTHYIYGLRLGI